MENPELGVDLFREGEVQRLKKDIFWQSFLAPLTERVCKGSYQRAWDKRTHAEYQRIQANKIELLMNIIPESWLYGDLAMRRYTSARLQQKIDDSGNIDHGFFHLDRYGNNGRASDVYVPQLIGLPVSQLRDVVMAREMGVLHDHVEIDAEGFVPNLKAVHAHLGAVNDVGVMQAMQLDGVPFTQRQLALDFHGILNHPYPLLFNPEAVNTLSPVGILRQNREILHHFPVLAETEKLLKERGSGWNKIDVSVRPEELVLVRLAISRIYGPDKRDSITPPLLTLVRTMNTDENRLFAEADVAKHLERLTKFLESNYQPQEKDFVTDLDRVVFELVRDYRAEGLSEYEVEWLGPAMARKMTYAKEMAKALLSEDFSLVEKKFSQYLRELDEEFEREKEHSLNITVKAERLVKVQEGVESQKQAVLKMVRKKSDKFRQQFTSSEGQKVFFKNLEILFERIVSANRLPLLEKHLPFPDDLLHVFSLDYLPI